MLQNFINKLNSSIFFQEFTFGRNQFKPKPDTELEFADNVLWLDDCLILIQSKERNINAADDKNSLEKWFENKVLKLATKQIRDTIKYLEKYNKIVIENEKGHQFNIKRGSLEKTFKVVIYAVHDKLPFTGKKAKFHISRTVGFIHVFAAQDYLGICNTLQIPSEIIEYLDFREKYLSLILDSHMQSEKSIIGRFLCSDIVPNYRLDTEVENYEEIVDELIIDKEEFDIRFIQENMTKNVYMGTQFIHTKEYYDILIEFAWLQREEMRWLKEYLSRSTETAMRDEFDLPYRINGLKRNCGFVITPIKKDDFKNHIKILRRYLVLNNYEQRQNKAIGISVSKLNDHFAVDYVVLEGVWKENPDIEKSLKEIDPFRPMITITNDRYRYRKSKKL